MRGHDYVARLGVLLAAHHDEVAVEDAGVDHRFAADPEHEEVARPGEVPWNGQKLLDRLLGQYPGAGSDMSDEGNVSHGAHTDGSSGGRLPANDDRPRLGRVALQVALPLQHLQMGMHGRRRREAHGFADLPDRRGIAPLADLLGDEFEDPAPLSCQGRLGHSCSSRPDRFPVSASRG